MNAMPRISLFPSLHNPRKKKEGKRRRCPPPTPTNHDESRKHRANLKLKCSRRWKWDWSVQVRQSFSAGYILVAKCRTKQIQINCFITQNRQIWLRFNYWPNILKKSCVQQSILFVFHHVVSLHRLLRRRKRFEFTICLRISDPSCVQQREREPPLSIQNAVYWSDSGQSSNFTLFHSDLFVFTPIQKRARVDIG